MIRFQTSFPLISILLFLSVWLPNSYAEDLVFHSRSRPTSIDSSDPAKIVYETIKWDPEKTAIIICDVWNTMICEVPARRVGELAVEIDEVAKVARNRGVTIVHAPSGTMDFYKDHPARANLLAAPKVEPNFPLKWNYLNPEREAPLPIDDSDNGWEGPCSEGPPPQSRQHPAIEIQPEDAIGEGGEIVPYLEGKGIENVILVGVHTNMCVLGRPFGIRQLIYLGKNVLLMRDLTDSLYNPEMPPEVSHFRGTEMVIEHIEKYWCPTIVRTDLVDKPPFRLSDDDRKHVAFLVSDDHYDADKTLPEFAQELREKYDLHCTVLHGEGEHQIPLLPTLEDADVAVVYVRRLGLPSEQLRRIQDYVEKGGNLVGMRTANHAFKLKFKNPPGFEVPEGRAEWPEFDAEILGGNYNNHAPNELGSDVAIAEGAENHPILKGVSPTEWHSTGSLYYVSPAAEDAEVLMTGSIPDKTEPILWTRERNGARIVYFALGHPDDFNEPQFRKLLANTLLWTMGEEIAD